VSSKAVVEKQRDLILKYYLIFKLFNEEMIIPH